MYAKILILLNLLVFALLASQPLFYLLALGITQKRLQAPAYIELRQRLDKNLQPRLGLVYYASLALVISLIVVSFSQGLPVVLATSLIALAALLADVVLAVKTNIPINRLINQWSADNYPRHWQLIRRKWFYFYHFRQAAGLTGLASLLVGAVFG